MKKLRRKHAKITQKQFKKRDENTQFGYLSYQIFENFQNLIMKSLWSNNCYILYAQMIACMLPNGVGQAIDIDNSKFELVRLVWTSYRGHSCWTANVGAIVNLHVDINNVLATTSLFSNEFLKLILRLERVRP